MLDHRSIVMAALGPGTDIDDAVLDYVVSVAEDAGDADDPYEYLVELVPDLLGDALASEDRLKLCARLAGIDVAETKTETEKATGPRRAAGLLLPGSLTSASTSASPSIAHSVSVPERLSDEAGAGAASTGRSSASGAPRRLASAVSLREYAFSETPIESGIASSLLPSKIGRFANPVKENYGKVTLIGGSEEFGFGDGVSVWSGRPVSSSAMPRERTAMDRKNAHGNDEDDKSGLVSFKRVRYEDGGGGGDSGGGDVVLRAVDIYSPAGDALVLNATITMAGGRRYGLCGRNGIGKTSLLKQLAEREIQGIPAGLNILHVEQEFPAVSISVLESVVACDTERTELLKEAEDLQKGDGVGVGVASATAAPAQTGDSDRLSWVFSRLEEIESDTAESRAGLILAGLGFTPELQLHAVNQFSGGWRMRVALACALYCAPDLLLLDEPTNMLDLQSVLWLTEYLKTSLDGTLLVVSHDRVFLNEISTDIIHIDSLKTLTQYQGNYDSFERTRTEHMRLQSRLKAAEDARRQHVQQFVDRFRFNAKRASLVQSRIKALNRMAITPAIAEDPSLVFEFPDPEDIDSLAPPLIDVQNVTAGYSAEKPIVRNANLRLDDSARVALVGDNGSGKTTIIRLLTGQLEPLKGFVVRNPRLRIGLFTQHHVDQLDMGATCLQFLESEFPGRKEDDYRRSLARYGLVNDLMTQRIETLSGGEKSRLALAAIAMRKPHLLIFDECENHLDVATVEVLGQALATFAGGVVLVSHNQQLVNTVCDDLFVVGDGKCTEFKGSFDMYRRRVIARIRR